MWTVRPLDGPYIVTNLCNTLDTRRTARVRSNERPIARFRGGFTIVGYSMQTTSLLLGTTAPMNTCTHQRLRSHLLAVACSYGGMYVGKLCSNLGNTILGRNELSSHS